MNFTTIQMAFYTCIIPKIILFDIYVTSQELALKPQLQVNRGWAQTDSK